MSNCTFLIMSSSKKLKKTCKFPNCSNAYYSGPTVRNKKFFRFPRNQDRSLKWKNICNLSADTDCSNFVVCEDHFTDSDYTNTQCRRLLCMACPGYPWVSNKTESFEHDHTYSSLPSQDIGISTNDICISAHSKNQIDNIAGQNKFPQTSKMCQIPPNIISQISELKKLYNATDLTTIRKLYCDGEFRSIEEMLSDIMEELMNSQLHNEDTSSFNDHNLTVQDKAFALFLYRFNPRLYRYLKEFFQVPPICYLKSVLAATPFDCGMLGFVLDTLKIQVAEMNDLHRFCCLTFAKTPLCKGFHYEANQKKMYGFEDLGYRRTSEGANCAFVFMIRGIYKNYNQVVAYYLAKDIINALELKEIIVDVIGQLQKIGLNVVATVCNQGTTNKAVLKALCFQNKTNFTPFHFVVNNRPIYTIFDVPNILKSTRNALLENIVYYDQSKFAKFEYIKASFVFDQAKKFKYLYKLQQNDFNFKDLKVKNSIEVAARQLSHSIASAIETSVLLGDLPAEAMHTANFVSVIDNLFDSLNGSKLETDNLKLFTGALSLKSPHLKFWNELLPGIINWKMANRISASKLTNCEFSEGWYATINAVMLLWTHVRKGDQFYFPLRNLNLDKIEDIFNQIKQHNTNLTCYEFVTSLKTIVLNDLIMFDKHSDCIFDYLNSTAHNPNLLQIHILNNIDLDKIDINLLNLNMYNFKYEYNVNLAGAYIKSYILRIIDVSNCQMCRKVLFSETGHSDLLTKFIQTIHEHLFKFLDEYGHLESLEEKFRSQFVENLELFAFCTTHNIQNLILDKCFPLIVMKYAIEKNDQNPINKSNY